jgi:cyclophilin family peptidyl-prolyl cis-trans isomerase
VPKNAREKELARAAAKREQEKQAARRKKTVTKAVAAIVVIALVAVGASLLLGGRKTKTANEPTAGPPTAGPPPMTIDPNKSYTGVLDTTFGQMKIALSTKTAPIAVNNFVYLADSGKYDGVLFHRIANSLSVIQAGDLSCKAPSPTCGSGKPGYTFLDELTGDEKYTQGVVAMANAGPNTNNSQFFIVTGSKAEKLPPNYAIFGHLADAASLKVAKTIQSQPVDGETPKTPIVINSAKVDVGR